MTKNKHNSQPPAVSGFFINWPVFASRVEDFICVGTAFMLGIAFCAFMISLFMGGISVATQWLFNGCVR